MPIKQSSRRQPSLDDEDPQFISQTRVSVRESSKKKKDGKSLIESIPTAQVKTVNGRLVASRPLDPKKKDQKEKSGTESGRRGVVGGSKSRRGDDGGSYYEQDDRGPGEEVQDYGGCVGEGNNAAGGHVAEEHAAGEHAAGEHAAGEQAAGQGDREQNDPGQSHAAHPAGEAADVGQGDDGEEDGGEGDGGVESDGGEGDEQIAMARRVTGESMFPHPPLPHHLRPLPQGIVGERTIQQREEWMIDERFLRVTREMTAREMVRFPLSQQTLQHPSSRQSRHWIPHYEEGNEHASRSSPAPSTRSPASRRHRDARHVGWRDEDAYKH